ncbi:MAG: nitroreductase family protein [Proteobacteria bacterium]|nr:nitroreductase family protein [Pseudomonadota bacterium]MBU1716152.1 nitroreductase family protein [Pseudomonadota bacterium]
MIRFKIDENRCIQCGECANDCPAKIITMENYPKITNEEGCYRCQHCLAICPTGAVSILGRNPDESTSLAGNLPDPACLETLIKGRRSVRRYTGRDLPGTLIDELLQIAWHAPTGVNNQSVLFTVVREGKVMDKLRKEVMALLAEKKKAGGFPEDFVGQYLGAAVKGWQEENLDIIFRGAPHLIITSAPKSAPCPVQDIHIALTTFQLMAHARGVGTVWDGMFMMALAVCPELITRLGIPEDHVLGYAMVFGEPAVEYHRTVQRGPAQVNVVC